MRTIVIIAASAALAACETTPPTPPPAPTIRVYQCAPSAGMTEPEGVPRPPVGDYSQEDVALYITELHQWGARGWLKVARVRERSTRCQSTADDEEETD